MRELNLLSRRAPFLLFAVLLFASLLMSSFLPFVSAEGKSATFTYQQTLGPDRPVFSDIHKIARDDVGNTYVLCCGTFSRTITRLNTAGQQTAKWDVRNIGLQFATSMAVSAEGEIWILEQRVLDHATVVKLNQNGQSVLTWDIPAGAEPQIYTSNIAVDSNGILYVYDDYAGKIIKLDSQGTQLTDWSIRGDGESTTTAYMAIDQQDHLLVGAYDQASLTEMRRFDSDGTLLTSFGEKGYADGQFWNISGITTDTNSIFVADDSDRVQEFSTDGTFVDSWNTPEEGIYDLAVDQLGNFYIAQAYAVIKLGPTGQQLAVWGKAGDGLDQGFTSTAATADADSNTYLLGEGYCSSGDCYSEVRKINAAGNLVSRWVIDETSGNAIKDAHAIALDTAGNQYILDNSNGIQKYDSTGHYIGTFGSGYAFTIVGDTLYSITHSTNYTVQLRSTTTGSLLTSWSLDIGQGMGTPAGIAVNSQGQVYITDSTYSQVHFYSAAGSFITKFGSYGTSVGTFATPIGIAIDTSDRVYVVDFNNSRVQRFASDGTSPEVWGSSRLTQGDYIQPRSVFIRDDKVYVTDRNTTRIFDTNGNTTGHATGACIVTDTHPAISYTATDGQGNLYAANRNCIYRYLPNGQMDTSFHPQVISSYIGGITVDAAGDLYYWAGTAIAKLDGQTGKIILYFGEGGYNDGQFPYNIVDVKVSDSGEINVLIEGPATVHKFSASGSFISKHSINATLFKPQSLFIDNQNNLWVSDSGHNQLQLFDASYQPTTVIPIKEVPPVSFNLTGAPIATDTDGNTYQPNTATQEIIKKDSEGHELARWGGAGSGNGKLSLLADPYTGIVIANNLLYITDTGNNRIEVFDLNGQFVNAWGSAGSGNGQFQYTLGMTLDAQNHLQVSDGLNNRIQTFDLDGNYLGQWGNSGANGEQVNVPVNIATLNNVYYVVSVGDNIIRSYDSSYHFIRAYSSGPPSPSSEPGRLNNPYGFAIAGDGSFVVADTNNDRLQAFAADGSFIGGWGSSGIGQNNLLRPTAVQVLPGGKLAVADQGNSRIIILSLAVTDSGSDPDPDPDTEPTPGTDTTSTPQTPPSSEQYSTTDSIPLALPLTEGTHILLTIKEGAVIDENPPLLTGYTTPFGWVEVTVHSVAQTGRVQANATGYWQWRPPHALEVGSHSYEARVINDDGSYGPLTPPVSFAIAEAAIPQNTEKNDAPSNSNSATPSSKNWSRSITAIAVIIGLALIFLFFARRRSSKTS
jgi:streptogramin lyase